MLKMPKIRSYIRLVSGFFIVFSVFFIMQSLMLHFRIVRNIIPFYFREKQDMVQHIKNELIQDIERDPSFDINKYITKHNARFNRLQLGFISGNKLDHQKNKLLLEINQNSNRDLISAVPMNIKGIHGYLILYSDRFRSLSLTVNILTLFMVITLLPALLIGFMIFRMIYRKSTLLVAAVEKVSQGDYSIRVNLNGNDEFSQIGRAFNKMAASIEKSTCELREMDSQRRKFIADISHELATPLTSLKGYVETLRMEELKLSNEEQQQYLGIVWDEAERLSFLVKDLLELGRMDAGTIMIECDRVDCQEFMKSFYQRNMLQLKLKGVNLEWVLKSGQSIWADYHRLEQIMQNLLDNALKHSAKLSEVLVTFEENTQNTVISFSDNGNGIPTEHLQRIFERFYKVNGELVANSFTGNGGDSGLGLSIVKGLVELHGGKIEVLSNIGQGTKFLIEFPLKF